MARVTITVTIDLPTATARRAPTRLAGDSEAAGLLEAIGVDPGLEGPDDPKPRIDRFLELVDRFESDELADDALDHVSDTLDWIGQQDHEALDDAVDWLERRLPSTGLESPGLETIDPRVDGLGDPRLTQLARIVGVPDPDDFLDPSREPALVQKVGKGRNRLKNIVSDEIALGAPYGDADPDPVGTWVTYVGAADVPGKPAALPRYAVKRPSTVERLLEVLADRGFGSGHAVGGSHGSSGAAYGLPGGLMLDLSELKDVSKLVDGVPGTKAFFEPAFVRAGAKSWGPGWRRVRVAAGVPLRELKPVLGQANLMFDQLGSYDGQTLFGASCTGTHGSGMRQPPICDYLCSVDMAVVLADRSVKRVRFEASDGPTDAAAFRAAVGDAWWLVQDDDLFRAVQVCFGAFGVAFACTAWVRERYLTDEKRFLERMTPTEVQDRVLAERRALGTLDVGGPVPLDRPQLEFLVNPYLRGIRHGVVTTIRTPREPQRGERGQGKRDQPKLLAMLKRKGPTGAVRFQRMIASNRTGALNLLGTSLNETSRPESRVWTFEGQDAFFLGAGRWVTGIATEVAFPIDRVFDAITRLSAQADKLAGVFAGSKRILHTSPYGLRFVRGSTAWLAPQAAVPNGPQVWAMIEMPMFLNAPGRVRLLRDTERLLVGLGGRAHWGQTHDVSPRSLDAWPQASVDAWLKALLTIDPSGFFDSPLVQDLEARKLAAQRGIQAGDLAALARP